tara:strand:+ start:160 stop:438 length:279 start_codon:yes stop_codon:yes gene_type:complete
MGTARAKVFTDNKGNRMLFPAYIYFKREDELPAFDFVEIGLSYQLATGLKIEDDWLEFDPANFPHAEIEIGHSGFAYGGTSVLLFDGPEYHS